MSEVDFSALEAELADSLAPGPLFALEDFSDHLLREAFANTSSRWEEFYEPSLLSPDAEVAFQLMTSRVAESPADGPPIEDYDPRLSSLLSSGLGGYAWRTAEEVVGRGVGSEIIEGVREAIGSVETDVELAQLGVSAEQGILHQASARVLAQHVPLWYTSPGHRGWGGVLYRAGRRFVSDRLVHSDPPPHPADIDYAFSFGVALRHVEEQLSDGEAPEPGAWSGPDWETCEIELRPDGRSFVAMAESGGERYVAAESRRLPANRLPLPLSVDRRPSQITRRHEQLVEALKQQGWAPIAGTSTDWWADRFRRRTTR